MKRKIQKSGARGYKVVLPSAFMEKAGVEIEDKFDSVMGEILRYTPHGKIDFPSATYELTKVPYGSGVYLSIPKQWVDHHKMYSGCEVDIDSKFGDIFIRSLK